MLITNFRWKKVEKDIFDPELLIRDKEKIKTIPLLNMDIKFLIGNRFCVGYSKNGNMFPCPKNNMVVKGYQCETCKQMDENLPCMKCTGICKNLIKRKECMDTEYFIYLAVFGPLLKVGISRGSRLKHRLIEQGADFGVKIAQIRDGRLARVYEQKIKNCLDIVDRIKGNKKYENLNSDPSLSIRKIYQAINKLKSSEFSTILCFPEIYDLRAYYNLVDAIPEFMKIETGLKIIGRIVSVKGNLIVVKNVERHACFNAHELIGREIREA
ncbi:MAG: DUF2797 domain-containing protein [Candidatus Aenigmatarchaeota archaeon]